MRKTAIAIALALLAGCDMQARAVQEQVRESLVDPDSARFGDIVVVSKQLAYGTVNAKNRMGGYAGQSPFLLWEGQAYFATSPLEARAMTACREVLADAVEKRTPPQDMTTFSATCMKMGIDYFEWK